jgi:peptidoglycan/xylan/chitin deacetylase (PgdA/CDA1 family)
MPWKESYTISDETTLPDEAVHWPDDNVCCARIVVDLGLASGPNGLVPSDLRNADAVYTMGQGLDIVVDMISRHGLIGTFAVPAMLAAIYPGRIRALQAGGHEIAVNGLKQENVAMLSRDEEMRRLEMATKMISDVTGQAPAGWFGLPRVSDPFAVGTVSTATVDLLIDAGYSYLGTGLADDIPHYWVTDFTSRRALLALPSYYHFNDQYFMQYPRRGSGLENPDVLFRNWRWEFDAQYARGRHFEMTIHPQHVAWSNRMPGVEKFLAHLRGRPGVWSATSAECAAYWLKTYPAESTLKLEPSTWQDYEGSMS